MATVESGEFRSVNRLQPNDRKAAALICNVTFDLCRGASKFSLNVGAMYNGDNSWGEKKFYCFVYDSIQRLFSFFIFFFGPMYFVFDS
jgi:hypothetical protein